MAITVKITKKYHGYAPDQVVTLTEFEAGHLMAFGYAVPYIAPKIEKQIQSTPEIRINPIETPVSFFKKRGRPKK